MRISRRDVLLGSAGALSAATLPFPKPAIAQSEPIKIGCLAAMTGPSSAPTIGFNRGVNFAADAINAAGGVKGRKIEIVMRDTQGDPTKAVNATQELISQAKVHAIWGPLNSGEALATTPIMARAKMPDIHPCVVESLAAKLLSIFVEKPVAFHPTSALCKRVYGVANVEKKHRVAVLRAMRTLVAHSDVSIWRLRLENDTRTPKSLR